MLLNEMLESNKVKAEELIAEAYEGFEHKPMNKEVLQEWISGDGIAKDIDESCIDEVTKIAQLQEKYINETNFSANVASFVPRLQPLLRRITPKLIGMSIAGVQPVKAPDSSIYMLKSQYSGTGAASASATTSVILDLTQGAAAQAIAIGDVLTTENGTKGTVIYVEADYSKAVVNVTAGTFVATEKLDVGAAYSAGANDIVVAGVYSNEAGFKQILPGYSGPYTTANGEILGTAMRQVRVNIVKQAVTVKSRKLKAELTIELIKDMQAQHGASADKEIMFFLELEIVNDINQELLDKYKSIATQAANFAIATTTNTQGRWAKEMYSGLYDRILKDKRDLAGKNRRGSGNYIVATAGVITAMESLGMFADIKMSGSIKAGENHADSYVGSLADGCQVFQDWFSESEYYMVIYKGQGSFDAGVIYSPYTPIEMLEATNPDTLQPIMGLHTRYGLSVNSLFDTAGAGASSYCTYRGVDFTSTPLV